MNKEKIKKILKGIKRGELGIEDALQKLRSLPYEDLGFAKIDSHRALRKGFPEVIFSEGKTIRQIKEIVKRMSETTSGIMAVRASPEVYKAIKEVIPEVIYFKEAKIVGVKEKGKLSSGIILVITGGTADIPVAEEAAVTAEIMGNKVERLYDVGVAGIHRLLDNREVIFRAKVLIVIAGMEGALPSVVGGLVDKPVIAVPTSIGYGASFQGIAPLLTMLNSCAPGVTVVNIDNGFGAGYFASLINKK
jgi:NCAIR mutase (PurE)-related protein